MNKVYNTKFVNINRKEIILSCFLEIYLMLNLKNNEKGMKHEQTKVLSDTILL